MHRAPITRTRASRLSSGSLHSSAWRESCENSSEAGGRSVCLQPGPTWSCKERAQRTPKPREMRRLPPNHNKIALYHANICAIPRQVRVFEQHMLPCQAAINRPPISAISLQVHLDCQGRNIAPIPSNSLHIMTELHLMTLRQRRDPLNFLDFNSCSPRLSAPSSLSTRPPRRSAF